MTSWTFFGRVLPERFPTSFSEPLMGTVKTFVGATCNYRVVIHVGQVQVDLDVTEGEIDLFNLRNVAENCVRHITDIIGYDAALSLDVDIISARSRDADDWHVFGINIPVLSERRKNRSGEIDGKLVEVVGKNLSAQMALADFREAMRVPVATGFFCYRAIEAMMQAMKENPNEKENVVWPRLNLTLCVDRTVIDYVKSHADFPRHGKPSLITDEERAKVFEITDEIIRRHLAYLMNDKAALSEQEFPLLKL